MSLVFTYKNGDAKFFYFGFNSAREMMLAVAELSLTIFADTQYSHSQQLDIHDAARKEAARLGQVVNNQKLGNNKN